MSISKIVALEVENVKRIEAVQITPSGSLVVVGGENDQGKSSLLDSIEYALAGAGSLPEVPLRRGAKRGKIVVNLGDLVVKRSFSAKGSSLEVTAADGAPIKSPQAILDALCGKIAFDPLEFSRMAPKEQAKLLQSLVGLDLSAIDNDRAAAYAQRTSVNRAVAQAKAGLAGMPAPAPGVPAEPVSSAEIVAEIERAVEHNEELRVLAGFAAGKKAERDGLNRKLAELKHDLELLLLEIKQTEEAIVAAGTALTEAEEAAGATAPIDVASLRERLAKVEDTNRAVEQNRRRREAEAMLAEAEQGAEDLTDRIADLDAKRAEAVAAAKFPIDGLGFAEEGVLLNGLPFEQASSSQRIRASAAIGLALNPKLRVMLVRDGSLLGTEAMGILAEMAKEKDAQIWVERVGSGAECSVVIEAGLVKEVRETAEAAGGAA